MSKEFQEKYSDRMFKFDENLLVLMVTNNDPRLIQRGSIVIKIKEDLKGDVSPIGTTTGVVMGGIYKETAGEKAGYLVWFDGTPCPTLVVGSKIKEEKK